MLSDAATAALRDIEHHINLATAFVAGLGYEAFRDDTRTVYAVTRCLEIISEASRRLPDELKARHPTIAWKDIAGAGNVYRHDYEDVSAKLVWGHGAIGFTALTGGRRVGTGWLRIGQSAFGNFGERRRCLPPTLTAAPCAGSIPPGGR